MNSADDHNTGLTQAQEDDTEKIDAVTLMSHLLTDYKEEGRRLVKEATAIQSSYREEANQLAVAYLKSFTGETQRRAASILYWEFEKYIRVTDIARACGLKSERQLPKWVMPKVVEVECRRCGKSFEAHIVKRTSDRPDRNYCDECTIIVNEEWRRQAKEVKANTPDLRTMPYQEYLKTDHWKATRQAALKRAKFRCQVCNTNEKPLHVHHRTYERRGAELSYDLVVLCEDCHRTFHHNGQLAGSE